jgi:hypothetical protein
MRSPTRGVPTGGSHGASTTGESARGVPRVFPPGVAQGSRSGCPPGMVSQGGSPGGCFPGGPPGRFPPRISPRGIPEGGVPRGDPGVVPQGGSQRGPPGVQ